MLLHRLQVETAMATGRDVSVIKCIVNLNQRAEMFRLEIFMNVKAGIHSLLKTILKLKKKSYNNSI